MYIHSIRTENKYGCLRQLNGHRFSGDRRQYLFIYLVIAQEAVSLVSEERLVAMALDALEQVSADARTAKVKRSRPIAVCLGFLATRKKVERWPFDEFWQSLDCDDQKLRSADSHRCLNAIYVQLGVTRTIAAIFKYHESGASNSG